MQKQQLAFLKLGPWVRPVLPRSSWGDARLRSRDPCRRSSSAIQSLSRTGPQGSGSRFG